ncbi:transposase [Burkholderia sp. D-99]|uniref:transposase n=1 Tax=Burkholderia sp. D-99 TaxID=2717316 RepID=UPI001423E98B|nr:transposase [Burkholderia sp. D-99]NHV24859.1 transposase [Burkholderia sp. D-99]
MNKHGINEEQINTIPEQTEVGPTANKLYRAYGISDDVLDTWRARFGRVDAADARRVEQLEDENHRLKLLVAKQALDIDLLWEIVGRKTVQDVSD